MYTEFEDFNGGSRRADRGRPTDERRAAVLLGYTRGHAAALLRPHALRALQPTRKPQPPPFPTRSIYQ